MSWYPDATRLAVLAEDDDGSRTLFATSILGGRPQRLIRNVFTASVSPDGQKIALIRELAEGSRSFRELWTIGPNGEEPTRLEVAASDESYWLVDWTPDSRFVALGVWGREIRIDLVAVDGSDRRVLMSDPNLFQNWTGVLPFAFCADDRLVYSKRDGPGYQATSNVWITSFDLESGEMKEEPRRLSNWSAYNVRELSVARDCSRVVVLRVRNQSDVYVAELNEAGKALTNEFQVTVDLREDAPLDWANNGRGLLIQSARTGKNNLYYWDLDSRRLDMAYRAQKPGYMIARFGIQPGSILVLRGGQLTEVDSGGGATRVVSDLVFDNFECARSETSGCVVGKVVGDEYVFFSIDLDTGATRELARTEHRVPFTNWDLSPDGKRVAVVHNDDNTITVVELSSGTEDIIFVEGWASFESVSWSADGQAFFVDAGFSASTNYPLLLRVEMTGQASIMRKVQNHWHISPRVSPDGRHLAFASMSFDGNAWLLEGF